GPSRRRTALCAAAAFLLPLGLDLAGGRYLGSGDTAPAELLPIAILEHGTLSFDALVAPNEPLPYWFCRKNGRIVSNYPILPGLLNVPVFAAAKLAGLPLDPWRFSLSLVTAAALAAFSVLFFFLALRHVCRSDGEALGFALLYAFATEVWSVAGKGLFQHAPSLFFLTLALWLLLEDRPRATALAGLALGLAVLSRPTNLLLAAPLAFYVFRRRRPGAFGFAALGAFAALLHAAYAAAYWGNPFSSAQQLPPSSFSGSPVSGLAGLLASPSRGLLVFSPVLIFAIPAGVAAFRRSGDLLDRCLVLGVLLTLALYAHFRFWWGGHSFGYRLLIDLLPALVLPIARFWPEIARSLAATALFAGLAGASIFIQVLGAYEYPSGFNENIDREPERLWQARGSEIPRLVRKLFAKAGLAAGPTPIAAGSALPPSRVPTPGPRWWSAAANDDGLQAFLEWPRQDAAVRGPLRVSGWAASPSGRVEVQILLSPGDHAIGVTRGARPDVCRVLPSLGDCSAAGFSASLPAPAAAREHLLVIELRGPGGRVRRLEPVRFFWRPEAPAPAGHKMAP
ncbi:MAG: hypothetical protein ACM3SU_15060, partial [Acidobacteriota bacterium]